MFSSISSRICRTFLWIFGLVWIPVIGETTGGSAGTNGGNTGTNQAPLFTTVSPVSVPENQNLAVNLVANDENKDLLNFFMIGGSDSSTFILDTATGALLFRSAPDYENPSDHNADNRYEVIVTVRDFLGANDTLALVVNVTNVIENANAVDSFTVTLIDTQRMSLYEEIYSSQDTVDILQYAKATFAFHLKEIV